MEKDKIKEIVHENIYKSQNNIIEGVDEDKIASLILIEHRTITAELEAKVKFYETVIANSNFSMAVIKDEMGFSPREEK